MKTLKNSKAGKDAAGDELALIPLVVRTHQKAQQAYEKLVKAGCDPVFLNVSITLLSAKDWARKTGKGFKRAWREMPRSLKAFARRVKRFRESYWLGPAASHPLLMRLYRLEIEARELASEVQKHPPLQVR
ncbi:MAG: hypothetical protein HYX73_00825 [Acidobacteria bacterium]|nr:hypothetical protein [Acidobacteriota bacterium]